MGVEIGPHVVSVFFFFWPRVSMDVILKKEQTIVPEESQRNVGLKSSIKANLLWGIFQLDLASYAELAPWPHSKCG